MTKFESIDSMLESMGKRLRDMEERLKKVERMLKAMQPRSSKGVMKLTEEESKAIKNMVYKNTIFEKKEDDDD